MWTVARSVDTGRFAELYARALDRLGDPMPHQRMGALCSLESLADAYPDQVQAIVEVLCAYARGSAESDPTLRETPLRMLAAHLRPGPRFWPDAAVNLAGGSLGRLDLSDCRMQRLVLDGASIGGPITLQRLRVNGIVSMRHAAFHSDVWFEHSLIGGPARFDGAAFHGDAWFGGARLRGVAGFAGAVFDGHAWFSQCDFGGQLDLTEALFRRSAGFRGATLWEPPAMTGTTFLGAARVSRLGEGWNVAAAGWGVAVDADNEAVGQLLWLGVHVPG